MKNLFRSTTTKTVTTNVPEEVMEDFEKAFEAMNNAADHLHEAFKKSGKQKVKRHSRTQRGSDE